MLTVTAKKDHRGALKLIDLHNHPIKNLHC